MKISFIIATVERVDELSRCLDSIYISIGKAGVDFEIIVIDQNIDGRIDRVIESIQYNNIIHIKSKKRGLSRNRNIGLEICSGDYICFPDDDSEFYENTVDEVLSEFRKHPGNDFLIGQIVNIIDKKKILKNWPNSLRRITKLNYYLFSSSITLFVKKGSMEYFDTNLGAGTYFGSGEDSDLIYRLLCKGKRGLYTPRICVWHPDVDFSNISLVRVKSYASGFGYFVRKDFDLYKFMLLCLLVLKKTFQLILFTIGVLKFRKKYFYFFCRGLIEGLRKSVE